MRMRVCKYFRIASVILLEVTFVQCFEKISFSKQFSDGITSILHEFSNISVQKCIEHCKTSVKCDYVDYRTRYHQCILLRVDQHVTVHGNAHTPRGYVSSGKTDWDTTGFLGCQRCGDSQICSDNGTICETKDCGSPPNIQLSTTIGNMYSVGDRISFLCEHNSDKYISECTTDGSWNITGIQCNEATTVKATTVETTAVETTTASPTGLIGSGWQNCKGKGYAFVRDLLTWNDAKRNCELLGSQLAKFKDSSEYSCVQQIFSSLYEGERVKLWIGANDIEREDNFKWTDGQVSEYFEWNNNQPDNALGNEDCVCITTRYYKWNDMDCSQLNGSICRL